MPKVNTNPIENEVYKVESTTAYSVAGSSSSSVVTLRTVEIEPDTFSVGDIVTVEAVITKSGSAGTWRWGLSWNQSQAYDSFTDIPIINWADTAIPAGVTYSNCYRKLVIAGTAVSTFGTGALSPPDGGNIPTAVDVIFETGGDPWGTLGASTNNNESIDWSYFSFSPIDGSYVNGGYFKIVGYVNNTNDRIRVEWMKVSGFASGSFIIPNGNVRGG